MQLAGIGQKFPNINEKKARFLPFFVFFFTFFLTLALNMLYCITTKQGTPTKRKRCKNGKVLFDLQNRRRRKRSP